MADAVVTFLLDNLPRLLVDEVNLDSDVKDKITSLIDELKFIDIFLERSDGKRNDKGVKEVVSQIRDVAHKAEDVVDTYVANFTEQRGTKKRKRNILSKCLDYINEIKMLHDVNAEIEKIKRTIADIFKNKDRYGIGEGEFKSGDTEAEKSLHKRRRDVEEEGVVGFMEDTSLVINQLMEGDSRLNVVSIVGMGGSGKTTLARKIYSSNQVQGLFSCRAWGYVSNDYRAKELLLSLLRCLMPSTSENKDLSVEELKKKVKDRLNKEKYLIVLDDIWNTRVWDEIKDTFPDDHHSGSRILTTSRSKEVARYTGTQTPHDLRLLKDEESWELFSKKVFRGEECPSDLEHLGKSIVKRCGGLPLAIVVLAGLLAKKEKSQREWGRIKEFIWDLSQDKTVVMDILKLSYDSLPRRLKSCFLYFGIYPEDYEIPARQLIRLWVAEGFIQPLQDTGIPNPWELEDVADFYLDELVDRSLVQVARRRSDGGVKTCRIHDLLRDLCISESKADKFLEVCTESSNISALSNPRRLSLHHCKIQLCRSPIQRDYCSTRSFLYFGEHEIDSDDSEWIVKNLKLARILDIGNSFHSFMRSIPDNLGSLIHLRYLHLNAPHFIPDSICSLWNLETLDIWPHGAYDTSLPSKMWELKRLRHLLLNGGGVRLPADPSGRNSKTMRNLQTLSEVRLDLGTARLLDNGIFPKLRKLGFDCQDPHGRPSPAQLQNLCDLRDLHTLKIYYSSDLPFVANRLPSNLTKITLWNGNFDSECMNSLGQLTKLQTLKLKQLNFNTSTTLNCADGEFLQLRVFKMEGMSFERWILAKGAMPRLQHLVIISCSYSTDLPKELWSLSTLTEVQVWEPCQEMANSLRNVEVKNGCKIRIEFDKMDN